MPTVRHKLLTLGYPWGKWFSKGRFRLVEGRDFDCLPISMVVQIYNHARRRGIKASIHHDKGTLVVRVLGKRSPKG
jgi:hypothetical protein